MSDTTVHNNLLEKISNPKDLKKLKANELSKVCDEVRKLMIEEVSKTRRTLRGRTWCG